LLDEDEGEVGEDGPVAVFVGIDQRAAGGGLAAAGVIAFRADGSQAVSMSCTLSRPVSCAKASMRNCS